jgi:hypothetical protein
MRAKTVICPNAAPGEGFVAAGAGQLQEALVTVRR